MVNVSTVVVHKFVCFFEKIEKRLKLRSGVKQFQNWLEKMNFRPKLLVYNVWLRIVDQAFESPYETGKLGQVSSY